MIQNTQETVSTSLMMMNIMIKGENDGLHKEY